MSDWERVYSLKTLPAAELRMLFEELLDHLKLEAFRRDEHVGDCSFKIEARDNAKKT